MWGWLLGYLEIQLQLASSFGTRTLHVPDTEQNTLHILYLILTVPWSTCYYLHCTDKGLILRKATFLTRVTELNRFLNSAISNSKAYHINHYAILAPASLSLSTQMNLSPSHKRLLAICIHFYWKIRILSKNIPQTRAPFQNTVWIVTLELYSLALLWP